MRGRFVVAGAVYHQAENGQPTAVDLQFMRPLETDEQVYRREVRVGPGWKPLDLGWNADNVGLVVISNEEGKHWQVIPTPEEKAEVMGRVVEVGLAVPMDVAEVYESVVRGSPEPIPFARVRTTEAYPFDFTDPASLRLRCVSGTARVALSVFPR